MTVYDDISEAEWWDRIRQGRCPVCFSKGPFTGGAIPVVSCECGNCRCEGCVDERKLEMQGLPPRGEKTRGGIIIPPRELEDDGMPDAIDLSGVFDEERGITYLGKAVKYANGRYRCLANVNGMLCVVEVTLRKKGG